MSLLKYLNLPFLILLYVGYLLRTAVKPVLSFIHMLLSSTNMHIYVGICYVAFQLSFSSYSVSPATFFPFLRSASRSLHSTNALQLRMKAFKCLWVGILFKLSIQKNRTFYSTKTKSRENCIVITIISPHLN